jgi:HK97 family phage major capsid protein
MSVPARSIDDVRRAYSVFQIDVKSVDAEQRIIEGIASTPELDRQGDIMDPAGAKFDLPLPLLWQHRADQPIGHIITANVTDAGIHVRAQIAKGIDFIDNAWRLIRGGLVRGLSIDWRPLAAPKPFAGGMKYSSWSWLALSAVTIPANQSASITLIKSLDSPIGRTASGRPEGFPRGVTREPQRGTTMNVSDQLTNEQSVLSTKSARLSELMTEEQAQGSLDDDQVKERDTLLGEVDQHTTKVKQLKTLEAAMAAQSAPLFPKSVAPPTRTTTPPTVQVVARPKGTLFTRFAMAIAAGKGSRSDSIEYARRFTDTPEVLAFVKALAGTAVPGAGSPPSGWGSELVNPNTMQAEFIDLLRPETIIGRVEGFRYVPFNIPIITQTGGSTFDWVGEGNPKPVGELSFDRSTLTWSKAAGIVVLTDELVRLSSPSAEATVRQDLIEQCSKFLDEQFIHVGITETPDHPASITNGANNRPATGTDFAALQADLAAALTTFDAAGISTLGLAVVTTPALARGISMTLGPMGVPMFPSVTPNGGTLMGYQLIVSASVEPGVIVIMKPSEVFIADDGRVTLDSSNQATIDMAGGTSPSFNLWQRNCDGIRAERWIRWQKRRDEAVTLITGAAYGPAAGALGFTAPVGPGNAKRSPSEHGSSRGSASPMSAA